MLNSAMQTYGTSALLS